MKKIIILIPVFNDWDSLQKLILEINKNIHQINDFEFDCLIVNDGSTIEPKLTKPSSIKSLKILNMIKNKGHARCNALGIRYVNEHEKFDYLILMDADGEDRPIEIKELVNMIKRKPENSVVAKRIKRSEGLFFQFLYLSHKLLTYFFTGKKINFGNYSCLTKKDVNSLSNVPSLWSSYSGTLKKEIKILNEINSIRGVRYFGPSKMSFLKLIIHSFSIIAVFKTQVFLRSILIILFLFYLGKDFGLIIPLLQILILIFNLIIFVISFRENENELLKSQHNLKSIKNIIH